MEKPKILIVDDKIENLIALETLLRSIDADIIRAESGNEALAKTLEHDFALALIDVQMPIMDGFETVTLMRNDKKTEFLPVIFVSAIYSDKIYQIKGIASGAVDFLVKPLVPEILLGKVNVFLKLYNQKRKLEEALENVRQLQGLLPICASCKKIRNDDGYWTEIEEYINSHADIKFSHGICPDCIKKLYPECTDESKNSEENNS